MSGTTPAAAAAPTGDQGLPVPALDKQSPVTAAALDSAEKGGPAPTAPEESTILTGKKLAAVFAGMMTALFTIALDQLILAPALPKIVSDFGALSEVTWVSGAYIMLQASFMPFFGQVCALYTPKIVFLVSITVFEIGSVVAASALSIEALIVGRAITGLGASGMMISMITLMSEVIPLQKRPAYMGLFGAVFGISSIVGPLLGGAFADHATWRWCFWINLPIGALGFTAILVWVKPSRPKGIKPGDTRGPLARALSIDWVAAALVLTSVTCLVLATTWGGSVRGWSDPSVIACLVVCGVLAVTVAVWEMYKGDDAMIVTRLFRNPSLTAIALSQIATRWILLVPTYYLPIAFQVIWNHSATKSGLDLLGLVLSLVITSAVIGIFVRNTGRYVPFLVAGPLFMAIGTGLFFTIREGIPFGRIIGFEVICGLGIGMSMQLGMLAAQAEYAKQPHLIAKVMGITTFFQMLGGIVGLAIAGAIFDDKLHANLARLAPGVSDIVSASPTELRANASGETLAAIITSYSEALKYTYICCVPIAALGAFCALFIKNRPLGPPPGAADGNKQVEAGPAELERKGSEGTLTHSADGNNRNSDEATTAGKA